MSYGLLLTLHLLAAIAFAGTVFFEVVLLAGARRHLPAAVARATEQALGDRAVAVNNASGPTGAPVAFFIQRSGMTLPSFAMRSNSVPRLPALSICSSI